MAKLTDLSGVRVKTFTSNFERRGETYWKLICECSLVKWASASRIKSGDVGACSCQPKPANPHKTDTPGTVKAKRAGAFSFTEDKTKALVLSWQQTRCDRTFEEILRLVTPLNDLLLHKKQIHKFCGDLSECHQELAVKLWRILPKFDPTRGSKLFSYLQCCLSRRVLNFASDSAKAPVFVSIDAGEDDNGNQYCPGMLALNRKAILAWRAGKSASLSSAEEADDKYEDEFPIQDKEAIAWLIATLSPDTASDSSAAYCRDSPKQIWLDPGSR